jgi:hypothetical protein
MLRALLVLGLAACGQQTQSQPTDDLSFAAMNDLAVADLAGAPGMDLAGLDLAGRDLAQQALPDLRSSSSDGAVLAPGKGQCWKHSQCPQGTCSTEAPGGICLGCGDPSQHCPAGFDICATGGACSIECTDESDCVSGSGMVCITDLDGNDVCALRSCNGAGSCPSIYECRGGFCKRVLCPVGNECPSGTTCRDQICVEDHLTF